MLSASLAEAAGSPGHVSAMPAYSVYGLTLATDFSIRSNLQRSQAPPDLTFQCGTIAPELPGHEAARLVKASHGRTREYFYLDQLPSVDVVSLPGAFDWYVWPDRIICHLHMPSLEERMEIFLLGTGLSFHLERLGIPALHASAVEIDGEAVAFLGTNRGGKSTLAVSFMQVGHPLITDDILPIEAKGGAFHGRAGYPQIRLWPEQAARLLGNCDGLKFVHPGIRKYRVPVGDRFGSFADGPRPLRCIYLPERCDANGEGRAVEVTPLAPRDALKELHAKSFAPMLGESAVPAGSRLLFWGALLRQVHVRRLSYPSGLEHLPAVQAAIRTDLDRLRSSERPRRSGPLAIHP
jgi:hypothetical protein